MALTPSAQLGQHDRRAPARRTLNFAAASFGCAPCLSLDPGGSRGFRRLRAALRRADKTLRKMKRCEERSATAPPPAPGGHSGASGSTAPCEGGGNAGSGARTRASVSTGGTSRHSPSGGDERRVDIGERSPASTISGSRDGRPGVLPPQAKALARPALHLAQRRQDAGGLMYPQARSLIAQRGDRARWRGRARSTPTVDLGAEITLNG
jgi:hypothetical protein